MTRPRIESLLLACGMMAMAGPLTAQQSEFDARLNGAIAALDSAEAERGAQLLRGFLSTLPPDAPAAVRVRADLYLGAASLSLGLADSARVHFADMVRVNPFAVPDTNVFNPDVLAAYHTARRTTAVVALRVASDTVIKPMEGGYLVAVAVGRPGRVQFRLADTGEGHTDTLHTVLDVDSTASFVLPLRRSASLTIQAGSYRLTARMPDASDSVAVPLTITRQPVDTAVLAPPLDSSVFRPEHRKGPPVTASAVAGIALGAVTAALPVLLANKNLGTGTSQVAAASMGVGISVAGVIGVFAGRRQVPIQENIQYNQSLVQAWQARNRTITETNARAVQAAPLRIRRVTP